MFVRLARIGSRRRFGGWIAGCGGAGRGDRRGLWRRRGRCGWVVDEPDRGPDWRRVLDDEAELSDGLGGVAGPEEGDEQCGAD